MLRSRVRRSFTVEVKSKTRQSLSWPEPSTPSLVNWAALDPAPETPSPFDSVWSDEAPTATAPPVAAEKPRRILQSLIVAEPEPDVSEAAIEREPRLPRVRRVKPAPSRTDMARDDVARAKAAPSDAIWSFADIADASADLTVATPSVKARPEAAASTVMPARKLQKPRAAEPALAPGERWKRRLPRSLR